MGATANPDMRKVMARQNGNTRTKSRSPEASCHPQSNVMNLPTNGRFG